MHCDDCVLHPAAPPQSDDQLQPVRRCSQAEAESEGPEAPDVLWFGVNVQREGAFVSFSFITFTLSAYWTLFAHKKINESATHTTLR